MMLTCHTPFALPLFGFSDHKSYKITYGIIGSDVGAQMKEGREEEQSSSTPLLEENWKSKCLIKSFH